MLMSRLNVKTLGYTGSRLYLERYPDDYGRAECRAPGVHPKDRGLHYVTHVSTHASLKTRGMTVPSLGHSGWRRGGASVRVAAHAPRAATSPQPQAHQ